MSSISKRRRFGKGNETDGDNNCDQIQELADMKSSMNKLMAQNRLQLEHMSSMMRVMNSMQDEVKNLRTDMKSLKGGVTSMHGDVSRLTEVEKRQCYHEQLLQNQKWEYKALRPSQEYWDNVEDDEREAAEGFLTQIEQATEVMRYGDNANSDNGDQIGINSSLSYNDVFLPHWEELATALEKHQYYLRCLSPLEEENLVKPCLSLVNMELSDTVIDLLSEALKSTHFHTVILDNNNLTDHGIDFALEYAQNNPILEQIVLSSITMSKHNIEQLCQIIKTHPAMNLLVLRRCVGEDITAYEMLQMVMTAGIDKLRNINVISNNIRTGGDAFISDFLLNNPNLVGIILNDNQFDDNDATAIARALKHNKKLRHLDLRGNNITNIGWDALSKAVFDDTSLSSVADSNHTCNISSFPSTFEGIDEMNGGPELQLPFDEPYNTLFVRQKKVYSILSDRNQRCSNVKYFEDVPVELLPEILVSIQQYSNYHLPENTPGQADRDVMPLSIVCEILQTWDKSLAVFEALSNIAGFSGSSGMTM